MSTPISRRQFFRLRPGDAARLMTEGRKSDRVAEPPLIRPPGALCPDEEFTSACERCGACADACPHDVIRMLGPESGANEDTPALSPAENACRWCTGFECIESCPASALVLLHEQAPDPIALATIDLSLCLNEQGTICDDCAAMCPGSVGAIRMQDHRPILDPDRCVGCGACAQICPAEPVAITISALRKG